MWSVQVLTFVNCAPNAVPAFVGSVACEGLSVQGVQALPCVTANMARWPGLSGPPRMGVVQNIEASGALVWEWRGRAHHP